MHKHTSVIITLTPNNGCRRYRFNELIFCKIKKIDMLSPKQNNWGEKMYKLNSCWDVLLSSRQPQQYFIAFVLHTKSVGESIRPWKCQRKNTIQLHEWKIRWKKGIFSPSMSFNEFWTQNMLGSKKLVQIHYLNRLESPGRMESNNGNAILWIWIHFAFIRNMDLWAATRVIKVFHPYNIRKYTHTDKKKHLSQARKITGELSIIRWEKQKTRAEYNIHRR